MEASSGVLADGMDGAPGGVAPKVAALAPDRNALPLLRPQRGLHS